MLQLPNPPFERRLLQPNIIMNRNIKLNSKWSLAASSRRTSKSLAKPFDPNFQTQRTVKRSFRKSPRPGFLLYNQPRSSGKTDPSRPASEERRSVLGLRFSAAK